MSQSGPITDCKEIALSIKGQKPPFKCPACKREYKSLTGIFYHIGQIGPSTSVPRCLTNDDSNSQKSPSSHSGLRPRRSATPPATPSTTPVTRATTPATTASATVASLIAPSHPSSPVSSIGGVTASGRRRPRRELTWGETQRLVEVEFDNNYRRVEIDFDLEISDEERQPVAEVTASTGRRGTPQKRGRGSAALNETPSRGGTASIGKPASLSTVKDKCKRRSKIKSKNDMVALPKAEVAVVDSLEFSDAPMRGSSYYRFVEQSAEDLDENVEYDMDEEDYQWLSLMNDERKSQGLTSVPQEVFEILMDRLEKECIFESQTFADGDDQKNNMYNIDENAVCCICNDGECHNTNAILFCDMCNLAVHQECYGVPYIPEGQWLCRRCIESPSRGVDCALCPNKGGAFKRTLDARWAHVICAIWIPEVQFANPVFLEPIDGIKEIPPARWKLTCYICRRRMGACIQCSKSNCCTAFHVTCAQQACLYMKIEPAKGGTVKKTGYCDAHTPPSVKRKMEKAAKELEMKEGKGKGNGKDDNGGKAGEGSESGKNGSGKKGKAESEDKKEGAEDSEEIVDVIDGKDAAATASTDESKKGKDRQDDNQDSEDDMKPHRVLSSNVLRARKMMEERRGQSNVPVVNIPFVPQNRLDLIISQVSVMKKSQFIPKLVNYWKLKRQSRNGVPLLRRLQANKGQRASATNLTDEERSVLVDQLALWKSLRRDLERARMLVELVRKREKLKREQLKLLLTISELQLRPLNFILKKALDRIARKDPAKIFSDPVSIEDVPDYLDIIRKPMDFYTMRNKLDSNGYTCLEDFEKDFKLVWHNATIYNQKDTIYYKAAIRIKEAGQKVLEQTKLQVATAGIHCKTGLHYPDVEDAQASHTHYSSASLNGPPSTANLTPPINVLEMNDESMLDSFRERRYSTTSQISLEEQMDVLQEKLQMLQGHTGSQCRRKEKALRKELSTLRRQQKHERKTSADTEDHSSVSSPRRQRAPSIPRNAEELASHLIHGSLRFTPSRQQILSHSGIRLEERASALKKEEEEAAAAAREQQQATGKLSKDRGRLHSSSDSMLLVRRSSHRSDSLTRTERRKPRGRSSEPSFVRADSDDNEDGYKTANSSASEHEEVIPTRRRKRVKEEDSEGAREEAEAGLAEEELKRKRVKKRRRERHKEDHEDDKTHDMDVSSTPKVSSSRLKYNSNKESHDDLSQATPRPKRPSSAASKNVTGKRRRKVRRDDDYEDYDEDDDYDGHGMDDEKDLSFSVGRPPKGRGRNKKTPANFPLKQPKAVTTPKQPSRQTRMRIKSSDTVTTESEVEGSRSEGVGRWVNGNTEGGNKPRKSGRLSAALRSSSIDIDESDTGATARKKRQERCRRSRSSSVYETAGEADFSEFESKRAERQKRSRKKPNSYFSDSENRDVFSEGMLTPPSATSTKDLTLHINESSSNNNNSRRGTLDHKRGGNKRKRSGNADKDGIPDEKKSRICSDGTEDVQHSLKSGGMVNGLVMNGDRATLADEIRPMELVWAKCRGYPPYPALVINPDIPEDGIVVRGEKIFPPSDEVMELKEKNPTSTYLVRFFDGRRTWQCLPPEKIEPLGTSVESDNAKIAMAGSSKRSVKEAFTRAKQWLQRKDKKSSSLMPKTSSHDSEPSRNSVDSDGEDYREV